jgi:peptide/nickel transport system substrate-binding protein
MSKLKCALVFLLVGSLFSAALVFARGPKEVGAAAEAVPSDTLTYLLYGEPGELDPATAYDARSWTCINNLYDRLIQYDGADASKFAPMLAERWEISADGTVLTFFLRKDVKFHDGAPMKAQEVKYSFDRVLKMNQPPSWMLSQMMDLDSTKVLDDYTVEVTLTKPYAAALSVFCTMTASVVNPAVVEANGGIVEGEESVWMNTHEAGTGPFALREWLPAERLIMDRFDDHYSGEVPLKTVIIPFIPEVGTRVMMLKKGDADIHDHFESVNVPDLLGTEGLTIKPQPSFDIDFAALGCRGPLAEKKLRQAVSYAFPYDTVLSFIYQGYSTGITGAVPAGMFGYYAIPEGTRYKLDLERASQLLDETGWEWPGEAGVGFRSKDGQPLEMEILVDQAAENRIQAGLMWQNNLAKIGFNLKVREIVWAIAYKVIRAHESDSMFSGWLPDYADPDNYADAILGGDNSDAIYGSSYSNPKMDELIDQAKWEPDRTKRAALYRQIQELGFEDAPYVWIAQVANILVINNKVKGYYFNPIQPMDFRTIYKVAE